jgi:hypothetical protein
MNWLERTFAFADLPLGAYPNVLEQLRGRRLDWPTG